MNLPDKAFVTYGAVRIRVDADLLTARSVRPGAEVSLDSAVHLMDAQWCRDRLSNETKDDTPS